MCHPDVWEDCRAQFYLSQQLTIFGIKKMVYLICFNNRSVPYYFILNLLTFKYLFFSFGWFRHLTFSGLQGSKHNRIYIIWINSKCFKTGHILDNYIIHAMNFWISHIIDLITVFFKQNCVKKQNRKITKNRY